MFISIRKTHRTGPGRKKKNRKNSARRITGPAAGPAPGPGSRGSGTGIRNFRATGAFNRPPYSEFSVMVGYRIHQLGRAGPGIDKTTRRKYRGSLRPRSHRSQGPIGPKVPSVPPRYPTQGIPPKGSLGTHIWYGSVALE